MQSILEDQMDKAQTLKTIRMEHANLESLVAPLSESQLGSATLEGQRSIKDILAHIAAWERLCARWIEDLLQGKPSPLSESDREENDDVLNERLYLENRDRPLREVQEDFHQTYQTFLKQVQAAFQALSDEDLNDPHRFPELAGHSLSALIASNSYSHYREHAEQLQRWPGNEQGE
jgi:hypothetical protein